MTIDLSIFIICKNEERIIETCLKQASKLASEIIIVDSGSTDSTLAICKRYTDKIFHQDWLGFGKQKNIALSKCSYSWVMSLDADEILSDELIDEIKNLDFLDKAYLCSRRLFIGDKEIRHGGFYPDFQLRIFKKELGRFCASPVHESVEIFDSKLNTFSKDRAEFSKLQNSISHYAYTDLKDLENNFTKYAHLNPKKKNIFKAYFSASYTFLYKYLIRLGFLDGTIGLKLALINARYSFLKYSNF